jgi:hypothetical protein
MVVCFRCSPETKRQLDGLLRSGGYRDYGEIMTAAVANLSVLEGETRREGTLFLDKGSASSASADPSRPAINWEGSCC